MKTTTSRAETVNTLSLTEARGHIYNANGAAGTREANTSAE